MSVIVDIDNTLLRNGTQPIQRTIEYLKTLKGSKIIVTGRPESQRKETVAALNNAGIKYSRLIMNPYDYKQSNRHKAEVAARLKGVTLAIDDNAGARAAYSKAGIKAVHPDSLPDTKKMWDINPRERM